MKKTKERIVYYDDLLHDDFAGTNIERKDLPENYKFSHQNPIYRFFSSALYYVVALPVLWLISHLFVGYKVVGKKKLRHLRRKGGYFVYGNHTMVADAFLLPVGLIAPRRMRIICSQEAMSMPLVRGLESTLGAIPLPNKDDLKQGMRFIEAIKYANKKKEVVLVFPEAHIWKYATIIRPFGEQAFVYPSQLGAPVVAACTTFKKRKILRFRKPKAIIHLSNPIYPEMDKPLHERAKIMRDLTYEFMVETASSFENYEYISYRPREEKKNVN